MLTHRPGGDQAPPMSASIYDLHASNAASRLDQLAAYAGAAPRRLLMVANDGFLTEEAHRRNLDVVSVTSAEAGRGAIGSLPEHTFDAAIFYCTLERLSQPEEVLRHLKRALSPGGVVMIIAPTIDSRTARLFRSAWWEFNADEPSLLFGRHPSEPAHQERLRRSDHCRR